MRGRYRQRRGVGSCRRPRLRAKGGQRCELTLAERADSYRGFWWDEGGMRGAWGLFLPCALDFCRGSPSSARSRSPTPQCEQTVHFDAETFFNFNGTGGVWRIKAVEQVRREEGGARRSRASSSAALRRGETAGPGEAGWLVLPLVRARQGEGAALLGRLRALAEG